MIIALSFCPFYDLHYSFDIPITLKIFWTGLSVFKVVVYYQKVYCGPLSPATSFGILYLETLKFIFGITFVLSKTFVLPLYSASILTCNVQE